MLRCAILREVVVACVLACASAPAWAQCEFRVWHAMSGERGAELERLAARFNAAQSEYRVALDYKGGYDETLAAVLDTRRSGAASPPPHVVQVHETGTSEMLGRRGMTMPLWQILDDSETRLVGYFAPIEAPFADAEGRLLALPFNSATPTSKPARARIEA